MLNRNQNIFFAAVVLAGFLVYKYVQNAAETEGPAKACKELRESFKLDCADQAEYHSSILNGRLHFVKLFIRGGKIRVNEMDRNGKSPAQLALLANMPDAGKQSELVRLIAQATKDIPPTKAQY